GGTRPTLPGRQGRHPAVTEPVRGLGCWSRCLRWLSLSSGLRWLSLSNRLSGLSLSIPPELVEGHHPPPAQRPAPPTTAAARPPRRRATPPTTRLVSVRSASCVGLAEGRPQAVVVHGFDVSLHLLAGTGGHYRLAFKVHLEHQ